MEIEISAGRRLCFRFVTTMGKLILCPRIKFPLYVKGNRWNWKETPKWG